jgi:uncharacterized paraquat-inducible protein A
MKKWIYQLFVYLTFFLSIITLAFFVFEVASSGDFNVYAVVCLVLFLVSIIGFVVNQIVYRRFKKRDASRYEEVECPHCHTMNPKREIFCRKCGKNLY